MILIIEGSKKRVKALHKELNIRAKRYNLDMLIEDEKPSKSVQKAQPLKKLPKFK